MKKKFPCGHQGQGKFCHRCKAADELEKQPPSPKPENDKIRQETVARLRSVPKRDTTATPTAPTPV